MTDYLSYSKYTDPGEYAYLFDGLPEDINKLMSLIKCQLIHPIADLPQYRDLIPPERHYEDYVYPTVHCMLAGLLRLNPAGLVRERPPEQRLVVTCRYHAIMLSSIMKYRRIPARVRYGFVPYLVPGKMICHIISEIWNETGQRWVFADPDRKIDELHEKDFETGAKAWQVFRAGQIDTSTYGVEMMWGFYPILDTLCHDFIAVLGRELLYNECLPVCADPSADFAGLSAGQISVLDQLASLMDRPDENLAELQNLYEKYDFLRYPPS
ncbi:MAG: transglutaminase domain-containing protein [Spirochaetales bacterium]|nr:transglutaminase domain-containing protein [Spirochaetales bacterium]